MNTRLGRLRLVCLDCNQESKPISYHFEILAATPHDLQRILTAKKSNLYEYFVEIGNFLKKHSGHNIVLKNSNGEFLVNGQFVN